jgi:hypothetical protein
LLFHANKYLVLIVVPPKGARLEHKTVLIGTYVFVIIAEEIPRAGL